MTEGRGGVSERERERERERSSLEKLASPSLALQSYSEELLKVFGRLQLPAAVHTLLSRSSTLEGGGRFLRTLAGCSFARGSGEIRRPPLLPRPLPA